MYLPNSCTIDRLWHKVNFETSKVDLNSLFLLDWLPKAKGSVLLYYFPIVGGRLEKQMDSCLSKMQTSLSKIWIWVVDCISYYNNHYTKHTSESEVQGNIHACLTSMIIMKIFFTLTKYIKISLVNETLSSNDKESDLKKKKRKKALPNLFLMGAQVYQK